MSFKLPRISGKRMVNFLEKKEFIVVRIRGSHNILKNKKGKIVVVPVHQGESLGIGIIREILKQAGISAKEYHDFFS